MSGFQMSRLTPYLGLLVPLIFIIPVVLAQQPEPSEEEQTAELQKFVDLLIKGGAKPSAVCGQTAEFGRGGALADGPIVYYDTATGKAISLCGGVCRRPQGRQAQVCKELCPPPGWNESGCRKY